MITFKGLKSRSIKYAKDKNESSIITKKIRGEVEKMGIQADNQIQRGWRVFITFWWVWGWWLERIGGVKNIFRGQVTKQPFRGSSNTPVSPFSCIWWDKSSLI